MRDSERSGHHLPWTWVVPVDWRCDHTINKEMGRERERVKRDDTGVKNKRCGNGTSEKDNEIEHN